MLEYHLYTISEINANVKSLIETFPPLWIQGEISNFKHHPSGHMYFSLKDKTSQLSCVMFKYLNQYIRFIPVNGLKIAAFGQLTLYERNGRYQFNIQKMDLLGVGAWQEAFEVLKQKLAEEGLFAEEYKKPLPPFPSKIGIVTASSGAALQDILNILRRRFPIVEVILVSVHVQGDSAAKEIADAIHLLNKQEDIDLIIIGRGGGSLEDLWAFNEEIVARAVFDSHIPLISAVGHEIDYTISDLVADVRAPTPSAAAEIAVPEIYELLEYLKYHKKQTNQIIYQKLENHKEHLENLINAYAFHRPNMQIKQYKEKLTNYSHNLKQKIQLHLIKHRNTQATLSGRLSALSPLKILERGYCICSKEDKRIKSISNLECDDMINLHFLDGEAEAEIKSILF